MNVKNLLDTGIKVILLSAVVLLFVLHFEAEQSLVYVDSQRLVAGYKGAQAGVKDLQAKSLVWKQNLDTLRGEVQAKVTEYESKASKLTANEKKLMEELIQSKQEQFANYQSAIAERIQKEDQELTSKVLSKVNDYIKRYGAKKGFKVILAATQYGNIIYAEEGMDVTEEVLKGLNAEFVN